MRLYSSISMYFNGLYALKCVETHKSNGGKFPPLWIVDRQRMHLGTSMVGGPRLKMWNDISLILDANIHRNRHWPSLECTACYYNVQRFDLPPESFISILNTCNCADSALKSFYIQYANQYSMLSINPPLQRTRKTWLSKRDTILVCSGSIIFPLRIDVNCWRYLAIGFPSSFLQVASVGIVFL